MNSTRSRVFRSIEALGRDFVLVGLIFLAACARSGDLARTTLPAGATPLPTKITIQPTQAPTPTATAYSYMRDEGPTRLLSLSPDRRPAFGSDVQLADGGRRAVYLDGDLQVYFRDLETGITRLVSAAPDGSAGDDWSFAPAISADGNVVAFFSIASNLAEDPYRECPKEATDKCGSLYIYEVSSGRLERLGLATGQLPSGMDTALSADGQYVAFAIPNGFLRIGVFLYDRATDVLTIVYSGDLSRSGRIDVGAVAVDISADGRFVAFAAPDNGIVPDDQNDSMDVFLYDRVTGGIGRVSKPHDGIESRLPSGLQWVPGTGGAVEAGLSISANGRFVVYTSAAPNLVDQSLPPCEHWWFDWESNSRVVFPACRHIYLYDRQTGTTELVSVSDEGAPGDYASWGADISADGRWVVFTSLASNLSVQRPSGCKDLAFHGLCPQVYLRDRLEGRTYLVSRNAEGHPAEASCLNPVITPGGQFAAFESSAGDLVPGVTFSRPSYGPRYVFITSLPNLLSVTPTAIPTRKPLPALSLGEPRWLGRGEIELDGFRKGLRLSVPEIKDGSGVCHRSRE